MNTQAIAIFVKTPGLSSVKTRLAATTHPQFAKEFYLYLLQVTKEIVEEAVRQSPQITPYWAVAEENGLSSPLWKDFNTVWQGEGSLGDRLSCIYEQLQKKHQMVSLIGADAPLLTASHLEKAFMVLKHKLNNKEKKHFVIGPAKDGGFYLLAGSSKIPKQVWTNVQYSQSNTAADLIAHLSHFGEILKLDELTDVDTKEDLFSLRSNFNPQNHFLDKQKTLLKWIEDYTR